MPRFDSTITWGNLLTIACGIIVAISWFVMIETANAKRDQAAIYLEKRVTKNETMTSAVQEIKIDIAKVQEKQDIMLQLLRDRRRDPLPIPR